MSTGIRRPCEAVDYEAITRALPAAARVLRDGVVRSARRDRAQAARTPAAARARRGAGAVLPRPVGGRGLRPALDPHRSTTCGRRRRYTVDDIRKSIEAHPPWGDYQGVTPADALREPMRVYMSGGTTGQSRPTFYTHWDREVGGVLTARALYMQGIRPGDVVLNSWAYGLHNGAFSFDEALQPLAQLRRRHDQHRQRHEQREAGAARDRVRRDRDPHHRRLPAAPRRGSPASTGYDPANDLKIRALSNIGDEEVLEEIFGVETSSRTGSTRCSGSRSSAPSTTACTSSRTRSSSRSSTPRPVSALPDGELGSIVRHRALQDRQPAVPLQHHGPVVPVPAGPVRVRQLAAAHRSVRRPGRQHGEAARRQRVARGRGRHRHVGRRRRARLLRPRGPRRQPRRARRLGGRARARPPSTTRSATRSSAACATGSA